MYAEVLAKSLARAWQEGDGLAATCSAEVSLNKIPSCLLVMGRCTVAASDRCNHSHNLILYMNIL